MTKMEQAAKLIERAQQVGCHATLEGNWVVWRPALPVDLLMESMDVNAEVAEIVRDRDEDEAVH